MLDMQNVLKTLYSSVFIHCFPSFISFDFECQTHAKTDSHRPRKELSAFNPFTNHKNKKKTQRNESHHKREKRLTLAIPLRYTRLDVNEVKCRREYSKSSFLLSYNWQTAWQRRQRNTQKYWNKLWKGSWNSSQVTKLSRKWWLKSKAL